MAKTQNRKPPKAKACSMGLKKMGRPESFDPDLAAEIIKTIETSSKGLKKLCSENEHWPAPSTIYGWIYDYKDFSDLYWKAKVNQAHIYVDDLENIIDRVEENPALVGWGKLTLQHRHWYAARLVPRLYGDKQKLDDLEGQNAKLLAENAALREHADKYQRDY